MKLLIYSINTLIIQILGRINTRLLPYKTARRLVAERLCYAPFEDNQDGVGPVVHVVCCDCGASHHFWAANNGIYGVPIRPWNYNYRFRLPVDAVLANDSEEERWNFNRYGSVKP